MHAARGSCPAATCSGRSPHTAPPAAPTQRPQPPRKTQQYTLVKTHAPALLWPLPSGGSNEFPSTPSATGVPRPCSCGPGPGAGAQGSPGPGAWDRLLSWEAGGAGAGARAGERGSSAPSMSPMSTPGTCTALPCPLAWLPESVPCTGLLLSAWARGSRGARGAPRTQLLACTRARQEGSQRGCEAACTG
jgi:hypothetical protein